MPKYRIETEERRTITREQWFDADSEDQAREQAEAQDWREWSEVGRDTHAEITFIELCEDEEA